MRLVVDGVILGWKQTGCIDKYVVEHPKEGKIKVVLCPCDVATISRENSGDTADLPSCTQVLGQSPLCMAA